MSFDNRFLNFYQVEYFHSFLIERVLFMSYLRNLRFLNSAKIVFLNFMAQALYFVSHVGL